MARSQPAHPRRPRHPFAPLVAVVLATVGMILFPSPASAHDSIVSSYPAASSSVDTVPDEISITFSAELLGEGGSGIIQVTGQDGTVYSEGEPEIAAETITQHLSADAPAGAYTVLWRVVSSDGHPTSGEYTFDVIPVVRATPSASPTESITPPVASPSPDSSTETDSVSTAGHGEPTGGGSALPVFLITGTTIVLTALLIVVLFVRNARRRRDAQP